MRRLRVLLLFSETAQNRTLSYQRGWPRHLLGHPRFECDPIDLGRRGSVGRVLTARPGRYDAVVLLHSVFSNEPTLRGAALARVGAFRRPKALFLGNEYKLLPAKVEYARRLGVSLLVSQLAAREAYALYERALGCAVVGIPNTGLDPDVFAPRVPWAERSIDLGYRSFDAPYSLGNRDRRVLAEDVPEALAGRGLSLDVSLDPALRLGEADWAGFLNACKGQLGSEAGGDYFELTDETRLRVNDFLAGHPDASFADVFERFFRDYGPRVSGRALSGRVIEAAGTKTLQVLLEGEYAGYFRPGEHYVPLRRDLTNLDEALEVIRQPERVAEIVGAAHEVALTQLTYVRLIDRFADALEAVL